MTRSGEPDVDRDGWSAEISGPFNALRSSWSKRVVDNVRRTQHVEPFDVAHADSGIVKVADHRLVVLMIHDASLHRVDAIPRAAAGPPTSPRSLLRGRDASNERTLAQALS